MLQKPVEQEENAVKLPDAVAPVVFESAILGVLFVLLQAMPLAVIAAPPLAVMVLPEVSVV